MKYTAILLMLLSASASADSTCNSMLVLHLASWHPDADLNESNPGIGFRRSIGKTTFSLLGAYRNSKKLTSVYIGAGKALYCSHGFCFNGLLAIITGYSAEKVLPALLPEMIMDMGATKLMVSYIPKFKDINETVVTVSLGFSF